MGKNRKLLKQEVSDDDGSEEEVKGQLEIDSAPKILAAHATGQRHTAIIRIKGRAARLDCHESRRDVNIRLEDCVRAGTATEAVGRARRSGRYMAIVVALISWSR